MIVQDIEDGTSYLLERRAILTGEHMIDSTMGFHPQNGLPVVNFRFDTAGARIFGNYTSANIGQLFAIVLDDEVVSAPRIQSAIDYRHPHRCFNKDGFVIRPHTHLLSNFCETYHEKL